MPLRITLVTLAALALFSAPAQADITVSNVSAKPTDTTAGAHKDFTLSFDLGGSETIRDLDVNLPAGLLGNPNNAAKCSQADFDNDACPAASKVGTQTVNVRVLGLPSAASGEVFNLVPPGPPAPPEPAQLGIKLTDSTGGVQHLRSDVKVRPSDSGLTSTIRAIPDNLNGIPLRIDHISLTLLAKSGSGGDFMTNPTSCDPADTTLKAVGYGNTATTGHDSFTPTNCAALPFAPKLTAVVGAKGLNGARQVPPLTTIIEQKPGEAATKSAKVTLMAPLTPNVGALANVCTIAQYDADNCPEKSIVGQAQAVTPLLATPLSGPVRIVETGPDTLPKLVLYLNGLINIRLSGIINVGADGTETTFAGIPDVPLSRFKLDFAGGPNGLVGTNKDLCSAGNTPKIMGEFTGHSGKTSKVTKAVTVKGCPAKPGGGATPRPVGSASLSKLAGKSPTLKVAAKRKGGGKRLRSLAVTLPGGLSFDRGTLSVGLKTGTGVSASLSGKQVLRLRAKSATGLTSIGALVSKGALKVSATVRKRVAKHPRVKIILRVTEVGGRVTTLPLRVKLR
jgi:hypothetical protein